MKTIKIKSLHIQNFKGCKDRTIEFGEKTRISGANATGKTTVFDAFTWLLFGKDSLGSAKFDIRPLDAGGKPIDNIEISVEAVVSVDEEEYSLKKVQKQVWRKKRGTNTIEFQGNVNEFEINGYPKSENEFKRFIGEIIDEDVFNLITNPNAFASIPWKEQREILMRFIEESKDAEIAKSYGDKFEKLIPELKIASTEDILKKYTKSRNILNKQMDEIPARIDEVSKQLVVADIGALEVEKTAKEVALKKVENELSGSNGKLDEINSKREEIMKQKFRLSEIQNEANAKLFKDSETLRSNVNDSAEKLRLAKDSASKLESDYDEYVRKKKHAEEEKQKYADAWRSEKAKKFPDYSELEPLSEDSMFCPTCGQELPEEVRLRKIDDYKTRCEENRAKYEKEKAEFNASREKRLKEITEKGQAAADDVRKYQSEIETISKNIGTAKENVNILQAKFEEAKRALDNYPKVADVSQDPEYLKTEEIILSLEREIEDMSIDTPEETELEAKKEIIKDEIAEIVAKINAADNTKINERIAELEKEKSEVGQRIAEQEQMIDLTENFIREKMNMISESVNEKFKIVSFKLFDNQINGGLKETCECTVNGVPYSSLNSGHKIIAGLDIIRSLSELYEINCPAFVDNAESINEFNIPDMTAQMILLAVSDDKELKVEVSE